MIVVILLDILFQVVQEYERAVIFRLGRLLHGGSKGPGQCQGFIYLIFITMYQNIIYFNLFVF